MLQLVAHARALFDGGKMLTAAIPPSTQPGDVLLAVLGHDQASSCVAPVGWTLVDALGVGTDALSLYCRPVGDNEPALVTFQLGGAASEWQGEVIVVRGASASTIRERATTAAFANSAAPATATAISQQPRNVLLAIWSCAGAPGLVLPPGFAAIDNVTSSHVSPRTLLIGHRTADVTGPIALPPTSAATSVTGRAFTFVLRDRVPIEPPALVDLVPGNVGLTGLDTRPPR